MLELLLWMSGATEEVRFKTFNSECKTGNNDQGSDSFRLFINFQKSDRFRSNNNKEELSNNSDMLISHLLCLLALEITNENFGWLIILVKSHDTRDGSYSVERKSLQSRRAMLCFALLCCALELTISSHSEGSCALLCYGRLTFKMVKLRNKSC